MDQVKKGMLAEFAALLPHVYRLHKMNHGYVVTEKHPTGIWTDEEEIRELAHHLNIGGHPLYNVTTHQVEDAII